jgi:hypothetical protein
MKFDKFLITFHENEIIDYFYAYAKDHPSTVSIQSISISPGNKNEF